MAPLPMDSRRSTLLLTCTRSAVTLVVAMSLGSTAAAQQQSTSPSGLGRTPSPAELRAWDILDRPRRGRVATRQWHRRTGRTRVHAARLCELSWSNWSRRSGFGPGGRGSDEGHELLPYRALAFRPDDLELHPSCDALRPTGTFDAQRGVCVDGVSALPERHHRRRRPDGCREFAGGRDAPSRRLQGPGALGAWYAERVQDSAVTGAARLGHPCHCTGEVVPKFMSPLVRPGLAILGMAVLSLGASGPGQEQGSGFAPVTDAMLQEPAPADWLMWRRDARRVGLQPARRHQPEQRRRAAPGLVASAHRGSPAGHTAGLRRRDVHAQSERRHPGDRRGHW